MKLVHDLKDPADRIDLGRKLALALKADSILWQGLDDTRRHVEQALADDVQKTSQSGLFARLLARLLGDKPQRQAPLAAEDYARMQGHREALAAFVTMLRGMISEAENDAIREAEATRPAQTGAAGRYPARVPGRSAM